MEQRANHFIGKRAHSRKLFSNCYRCKWMHGISNHFGEFDFKSAHCRNECFARLPRNSHTNSGCICFSYGRSDYNMELDNDRIDSFFFFKPASECCVQYSGNTYGYTDCYNPSDVLTPSHSRFWFMIILRQIFPVEKSAALLFAHSIMICQMQ